MAPFTRPWDRDADHRCSPTFRLMSNDPLLYTINLDSLIRTAFKQEEKKYDPSTTTIDNLHSLSRISLFNNNKKSIFFFLSLQICITAAREGGRTHQEPVMPPVTSAAILLPMGDISFFSISSFSSPQRFMKVLANGVTKVRSKEEK